MNGIPEIGQTVLNFIGGKWEPAASDKWTERYDPADTNVLVGRAPDSSRADARRAIERAAAAFEAWRDMPAPRRGRILLDWLAWVDSHKEQIANLLTREEGKTIAESMG